MLVTIGTPWAQDCDKRAQDYQRNSKMMREQYETSCRQLGLQGVRLKTEIVKLLDELPQVRSQSVGRWVRVGEVPVCPKGSPCRSVCWSASGVSVGPRVRFLSVRTWGALPVCG